MRVETNDHVCDFDQIHRMIHEFGLTKSGKNMPNPAYIRNEEGLETIDFRFLVRWHTLNPETQEPDTWPVYENLKVFIFSDESRMNIWILKNGKYIKDQRMHCWFIDFDKDGNITDVSESLLINYEDDLEPDRPCDRLIKFIGTLYNNHVKQPESPTSKWQFIRKKNGGYYFCVSCNQTIVDPRPECPKCHSYMSNWDSVHLGPACVSHRK